MKLREVAYTRCGDKGDVSNVAVFPYFDEDWGFIKEQVTVDRVAVHFARTVGGPIVRYELPRLPALNFVMQRALDGGGSASLLIDSMGKTYQSFLLDLDLDGTPPSQAKPARPATPDSDS
jgi:hypothetical protein